MAEPTTERELDEIRDEQAAIAQTVPHMNSGVPGASDAPPKRTRGRPKGSKNKKTLEAMQAGGIPPGGTSTSSSQPGEKRKRGRPPKVPYHLQFTDPSIIHDAIQSQEAADAASGKVPPRKRGRPPKHPKPQVEQSGLSGGTSGGAAQEVQGDEAGGLAKRIRSDGNE